MIVELKPDKNSGLQNIVPSWCTAAGFVFDPDNYTYMGFCDSDHVYKIPDSVKVLTTAAEAKERAQNIHVRYPFKKSDDSTMTTGEVDTFVDDLINQHDIGGAGTPCNSSTGQKSIDDTDSPYALRYTARTVIIDSDTANVTVDIPTAVGCAGLRFTFVLSTASGAFTVTLDPAGSETINGATTDTSLDAQYDTMTIESDGANWLKV